MLHKTEFYIVLICSLLINYAKAQTSVGIAGGVAINRLIYSDPLISSNLQSSSGIYYNVLLKQKIANNLYLELNPGVITKNYSLTNNNAITQYIYNRYIVLPVNIAFRKTISRIFFAEFGVGMFAGYWLSSKLEGQIPDAFDSELLPDGREVIKLKVIKSAYEFNNKVDNRFEYGLVGKVSVNYTMSSRFDLVSSLQLCQSLSDQQKKISVNQTSKINQTWLIGLGLLYNISFVANNNQ